MDQDNIFYPGSREVCTEFLNYLVQNGWIKKNTEGLYDELPKLEEILGKYLIKQTEEFRKYIEWTKKFGIDPTL